jgi:hemerythrin-like domain-containing protein
MLIEITSEKIDKIRANPNNDWDYISYRMKLSEDFIREFSDKVHWGMISEYQIFSEDFIREFADKVDWKLIVEHQDLSDKFKSLMIFS